MPTGVYERKPMSLETKAKIAARLKGNTNGRFRAGIHHTEEAKKKMSEAKIGKKIGPQPSKYVGDPGYMAIHNWIRRHYEKTGTCECCNVSGLSSRHTHWSNISGKYLRDRPDYWELCVRCHKLFDYIKIIDGADKSLIERLKSKIGDKEAE